MTVIRYRSSAVLTSSSAFCHGCPVGTKTTSSSRNRLGHLARRDQVSMVDRVERAAHDADPPAPPRRRVGRGLRGRRRSAGRAAVALAGAAVAGAAPARAWLGWLRGRRSGRGLARPRIGLEP